MSSTAPAQLSLRVPELIRVNENVYCAAGYALGNVIFVLTGRSVVVVDTAEGQAPAQAAFDDFRKISTLPVSYIIYTHHHGDHINGAKVFAGPETQIIAQKAHGEELRKYRMLGDYNRRLNRVQWAAGVPRERRGVTLGVDLFNPPESGYIEPQITFDEEYCFAEGGRRFELYHTQGETVDHLMVWLPDYQTLLPGDLFYQSFPMLASPGKPDRPVLEWAASLDRMRLLSPEYLASSHSHPLKGRDTIDESLANYARAIRYVHDETVCRINEGKPLYQIQEEVRLPPDLAVLPYLRPVYGTVGWGVRGIFRQYTGWYDFDPAHLRGGDPAPLRRALAEAAGNPNAIAKRAREAAEAGQFQLALELADTAIGAGDNEDAHRVRAQALERLAAHSRNGVERNIYRQAAIEERQNRSR
jgi:alkyl sulfatase BDS1-like metallo-beta-lactamase superfamily hydrolase